MKNFFYRIFCGFFLGISVFAPGVSGSVMAVMMGIYQKLITIVSNPFKNLKKNIIYLFPMGIGAVISFVLFILVFGWLFETYEKATYLLFMGLIAGNLPIIFKEANVDGFKKRYIIAILAAFAVALTFGILRATQPEMSGEETTSLIYVGISSAVAGIASMMPGMSISMVLMVFGVYKYLMNTANSFISRNPISINFTWSAVAVIAVAGVCFVTGMVAFSHLTKWVLKRYHNFAYFMVFGFMCGSLISIYLMPKSDANFNWFVGALMLLIGLGISALFVYLSKSFNTDEESEEAVLAEAT